jgi:hypothetical protein
VGTREGAATFTRRIPLLAVPAAAAAPAAAGDPDRRRPLDRHADDPGAPVPVTTTVTPTIRP